MTSLGQGGTDKDQDGVEIPKIAIFSISTLLGTLKIHILLDKMVLR